MTKLELKRLAELLGWMIIVGPGGLPYASDAQGIKYKLPLTNNDLMARLMTEHEVWPVFVNGSGWTWDALKDFYWDGEYHGTPVLAILHAVLAKLEAENHDQS